MLDMIIESIIANCGREYKSSDNDQVAQFKFENLMLDLLSEMYEHIIGTKIDREIILREINWSKDICFSPDMQCWFSERGASNFHKLIVDNCKFRNIDLDVIMLGEN